MTKNLTSRRMMYAAFTSIVAACLSGQPASGQTAPVADCTSSCGGNPSDSECNTACNAAGCPAGWFSNWTWSGDATTQRCQYTINFTPGTQGPWIPTSQQAQRQADACAASDSVSIQFTEVVEDNATATVTFDVSASFENSLGASINSGIVGVTNGLKTTAEFKAGTSLSSSVKVTQTEQTTLTAPKCGRRIGYKTMFKAARPATGKLVMTFQGVCSGCSNTAFQTVKSCTVNITLDGSDRAGKWTLCDVECPGPPSETCPTSATHNGTCAPNVY